MFKETGARKKTTQRSPLDTEANLQHELEKANMACSVSHDHFSREKSQLQSSLFSPAGAPPGPLGSAPPCCNTQQMMGKIIATMTTIQATIETLGGRVMEISDELSDVGQYQANLAPLSFVETLSKRVTELSDELDVRKHQANLPEPMPEPQPRVPQRRNSSQARDCLTEPEHRQNRVSGEESLYRHTAVVHSPSPSPHAPDLSQQSAPDQTWPGQEKVQLSTLEQDQVGKMLRNEHDQYYTRTLEVKLSDGQRGFWDQMAGQLHRSPWKWARSILGVDTLQL